MERVVAGVLVVEEFNWKSMATKMPLLRLATTAVKGAVLKLEKRCPQIYPTSLLHLQSLHSFVYIVR